MLEGMYIVSFSAQGRSGGGVLFFTGDKVYGGDSSFFYCGEFREEGQKITGEIRAQRHNEMLEAVFGNIDSFSLNFESTSSPGPGLFHFKGALKEDPSQTIIGSMQHVLDLPKP